LIRAIGPDHVVSPVPAEYLTDFTRADADARRFHRSPDGVVLVTKEMLAQAAGED